MFKPYVSHLFKNYAGTITFSACRKETVSMDPTLAEALAIRWCLQFAKEQNLEEVVVQSDASVVIECIRNSNSIAAIEAWANCYWLQGPYEYFQFLSLFLCYVVFNIFLSTQFYSCSWLFWAIENLLRVTSTYTLFCHFLVIEFQCKGWWERCVNALKFQGKAQRVTCWRVI